MRATPLVALIALGLTACGQSSINSGLTCKDDASCDPSDLCLGGQCNPEGSGLGSTVYSDINAAPAAQTIAVTVAQASSASVTLADEDSIAHELVIACTNGIPSPVSLHLAAGGTGTISVAIAAPIAAGTTSIHCNVNSVSGATAWTGFAISVNASAGSGGGSGGSGGGSAGGTAGGAGGGAAGGSAGGTAGGSAGGTAGGSGGGTAGGSGGGTAGGSGGGHAGGTGGGTAGGTGGGTAGGSGGGSAGGAGGGSAGGSGSGVGVTGGSVDHLFFAVIGDSRPANIDQPSTYPSAIVSKIYADIQAMNPRPQFVVATGDYMYANTTTNTAQPQATDYMTARAAYTGALFPAMGNHENDGYTADNCIPPAHNPSASCTMESTCACNSQNYTSYIGTILKPLGISLPYYSIPITATDKSWTAKLVVVACNAWDATQSAWLSQTLAASTTYTILARHEPASSSPAGPCQTAAEKIMASSTYDLSLVGHAHEFYGKASDKEITVGNGGAPLTASYKGNYGYTTVERISTGWQIKNYDYSTALPVTTYVIP